MANIKKIDKEVKNEKWTICSSVTLRLLSLFLSLLGPLFLLYINVRCEKNQCILLQFPLVLPTHISAYFSIMSWVILVVFLALMFSVSFFSPLDQRRGKPRPVISSLPLGFTFLIGLSALIACTAYMKPAYIVLLRSEHLRLLCATTVFCIVFSIVLTLLITFDILKKEIDRCFPMALIHGYNTRVKLCSVNLKYFFYVHAGLVAWGLLDLVIFMDFVLKRPVTAPLLFIFTTQYIMILHTLFFEKFLFDRPFQYTEGLGFFWMMRVLLFTPFLFSLPVLYTAVSEIVIPKPAMLANCALFMFGFVIYISSLHQKENFLASPNSARSLKSILTSSGKRLLVGGYWGTVQKPDYLGYMIIWLSWVIACGFSAASVVVLGIVYATVFFWLSQSAYYHKEKYGSAWNRYNIMVPNKIIPLVY